MEREYLKKIEESSNFIRKKIVKTPDIALVLGSGLGIFAEELTEKMELDYNEIPNFLSSTVKGHSGKLIAGYVKDKYVLCMSGRWHFYEGYKMQEVTFAIRVFKALGIESLILTNASGGINESYKPGDYMIITDHINFTGKNPLIGKNYDELGERFPDMSFAYDREYIDIAKRAAKNVGIDIKTGVYAYMIGPSFETPAEVRALRILGADAVAMSTVPEVIVARHSNIRVLAISCITNMAAGILQQELSHSEVNEISQKSKDNTISLLREIITNL